MSRRTATSADAGICRVDLLAQQDGIELGLSFGNRYLDNRPMQPDDPEAFIELARSGVLLRWSTELSASGDNWAPLEREPTLWHIARQTYLEAAAGKRPTGGGDPERAAIMEALALSYANPRTEEEAKEDTLLLITASGPPPEFIKALNGPAWARVLGGIADRLVSVVDGLRSSFNRRS